MSLHWDVSKVAEGTGDRDIWERQANGSPLRLKVGCESVVLQSMAVDVGALRHVEDVAEFFIRLEVLRRLFPDEPPMRGPDGAPRWHTLAEVERMRGLSTNVATLSRARWLKRMLKLAGDRAVSRALEVCRRQQGRNSD